MTITITNLGQELADTYDIDPDAAENLIHTYAEKISGKVDTYVDDNTITVEAADGVRDHFTTDYRGNNDAALSHDTMLDAIREADTDAARTFDRRDDLIRAAVKAGVRIVDIAEAADMTRSRVYQIRDRRR